jgi:hypothetical protein
MKKLPTTHWIAFAGLAMLFASGCQCCPLFDHYANAVDDVSDTHLYFDNVYNPRFDITRMGKPDWAASPFNRFFCRRCCTYGSTYDRYDDCNLYPPLWPFQFPSFVMPPPTFRYKRESKPAETDEISAPDETGPIPSPGAVSPPTED